MRHQNKGRSLSRTNKVRKALMKSMAVAFFEHEKIVTTHAKARELRPFVEKIITKGKSDTMATRRQLSKLFNNETIKRIISISKVNLNRNGGYCRIVKMAPRKIDSAEVSLLELVDKHE